MPDRYLRPVRSYVLREGRMTPGQRRALEEFWPRYGREPSQGLLNPLDWRLAQDQPPVAIVMDIGFGMGDALLETAQAQPHNLFIGVEVHGPGVGHLLNEAARCDLNNLLVYRADASAVLQQAIAPASLDRVQVLFPDPWPKKRHHKRRLLNTAFLQVVCARLKAGGIVHMATDWQPYADFIADAVTDCPQLQPAAELPWRATTKYEKRAQRLGHEVVDLVYQRSLSAAGIGEMN